jgi:hypothetical protein
VNPDDRLGDQAQVRDGTVLAADGQATPDAVGVSCAFPAQQEPGQRRRDVIANDKMRSPG